MPPRNFIVHNRIKKNDNAQQNKEYHKESDHLVETKKRLGNATKHMINGYSGPFIKYPLIDKYANSVVSDNVLDFATAILEKHPYNNSTTALDITKLNDNDKNAYISHLKSYMRREQHGLNNEWVPDGSATYASGIRSSAIADIAVPSNGKIIEIWLVCNDDGVQQKRIDTIIETGYTCPIYKLYASWLNRKDIIAITDPKQLYALAREHATQLNKAITITPYVIQEARETQEDIAKTLFSDYIMKELPLYTPCIDYSMLRNKLKMNIALEYAGAIHELWKICGDSSQLTDDIIKEIKENGYKSIPIYEIKSSWIIDNKDNEYLYANAKKESVKWN
jgi:hypothetical protein